MKKILIGQHKGANTSRGHAEMQVCRGKPFSAMTLFLIEI